jgi:hypothetical protein
VNQSTIIFGYLFVAFLLYITQRGALPIYLGFILATPKTPASGPQASGSGALTGDAYSNTQKQSDLDAARAQNFASTVSTFAKLAAVF